MGLDRRKRRGGGAYKTRGLVGPQIPPSPSVLVRCAKCQRTEDIPTPEFLTCPIPYHCPTCRKPPTKN